MSKLYLPGSKSITNRILTLAGMSNKPVRISNFLFAEDTSAGLKCLEILGFTISITQNSVHISPPNFNLLNSKKYYNQTLILELKSAGTLARFFPAVVLNWQETFPESEPISVKFNASHQLSKRPIILLINALKDLRANIQGNEYPFIFSSSTLSGKVEIDTTDSSQFLSGLLFAEYGANNSKIQIQQKNTLPQPGYVEMTKKIINDFHSQKLSLNNEIEYTIEPDASTACYYLAAAFLLNHELTIEGIGKNSLQPDIKFCYFLEKLGAQFSIYDTSITIHKHPYPKIKGGFEYDFSEISDQALTAAMLAIFANAPILITGVAHIRNHESNRITSLVKNFKQFNWKIKEQSDGFTIYPIDYKNFENTNGLWNTYHDHRFAMSGFLLNLKNKKIMIEDEKCVSKTSPNFFNDISNLTTQWNPRGL